MALDIDKLLGNEETVSGKETVSEETVSKETVSEAGGNVAAPVATGGKKPPKKKGKPRGGNSPMIGNNGLNLEDGDNAKFMDVQIALLNMPDIDMNSVEEVHQRILDYFSLYASHDMKPTVVGLGLALNGMDRRRLWEIKVGANVGSSTRPLDLPPGVVDAIKKAYKILENLWETYMNSGKMNPVSGIFLGKNNYGYQDKTEYVLTPNQQTDNDYDADSIRERYMQSGAPKQLTDGSDYSDEDQSD